MPKKRRLSTKVSRNIEGMLFILPWFLVLLIFLAFPLGFSLYMSLQEVRVLPTCLDYVANGFGYYREILFNSSSFYDELIPYFQEVIIMIPIILIFSLLKIGRASCRERV